ncbi:hypothetical protein GQ600_15311 [Phytophthora cactorum]|nr:hypothetical protein GQ600_15311 [Phytophthora cactorum]
MSSFFMKSVCANETHWMHFTNNIRYRRGMDMYLFAHEHSASVRADMFLPAEGVGKGNCDPYSTIESVVVDNRHASAGII